MQPTYSCKLVSCSLWADNWRYKFRPFQPLLCGSGAHYDGWVLAGVCPDQSTRLEWETIDLDRKHFDLPAAITKDGERRIVEMSNEIRFSLGGRQDMLSNPIEHGILLPLFMRFGGSFQALRPSRCPILCQRNLHSHAKLERSLVSLPKQIIREVTFDRPTGVVWGYTYILSLPTELIENVRHDSLKKDGYFDSAATESDKLALLEYHFSSVAETEGPALGTAMFTDTGFSFAVWDGPFPPRSRERPVKTANGSQFWRLRNG